MAKAGEDNSNNIREMNHISMKLPVIPRDLLKSFSSEINFKAKESEEKSEEMELSLGLSLNGHFGIDPKKKRGGGNAFGLGLTRSSSIPDFLNQPISTREEDEKTSNKVCLDYVPPPIMRACSLPVETEEECRKRKELQSLRRMEAKRKRTEKQRNLKALKEGCVENGRKVMESVNGGCKLERMGSLASFGSGNGGEFNCGEGLVVLPPQPLSHGSFGSQGSGSSGISESDSQKEQGMNKSAESRSPASVHSLPEGEQKSSPIPLPGDPSKLRTLANGRTSSGLALAGKGGKEAVRNVLEDMPCVSTMGDGPNGKRIEGFLYRYRKGEEVRIVCVCHGSFLTPAEFIKHAGGSDVQNPLKHIVVIPSSLL